MDDVASFIYLALDSERAPLERAPLAEQGRTRRQPRRRHRHRRRRRRRRCRVSHLRRIITLTPS